MPIDLIHVIHHIRRTSYMWVCHRLYWLLSPMTCMTHICEYVSHIWLVWHIYVSIFLSTYFTHITNDVRDTPIELIHVIHHMRRASHLWCICRMYTIFIGNVVFICLYVPSTEYCNSWGPPMEFQPVRVEIVFHGGGAGFTLEFIY